MKTIASRARVIAAIAAVGLVGGGCEDPVEGLLGATEPEEVFDPAAVLVPETPTTQNGYVNELTPSNPTVRLLNDAGAPRPNVRVRFTVLEGGGRVSSSSVYTDAMGYARVRWRLGPEPGRNRLRAAVTGQELVRFIAWATVRSAAVADVEVTPGDVVLAGLDESAQLVAHAFDASGAVVQASFTWESTNPSIASVNASGLVSAVSEGTTHVIARAENGVADSALVTVDALSTPAGLIFSSDFSTALGTSLEAVSDGGRWDFVSVQRGPLPNKEIVASTGLDFPTANVYRVIATAEDQGWSELRVSTLPIPAVGEHRYYRWYYRLVQPDNLQDNDTHPIQDGGAIGASNWAFHIRNTPFQGVPAGTFALHWTVMGEANAGNSAEYRWYLGTEASPTPLQKNRTYRVEVHFHRISTTHYRLDARIYDTAGNLLYDANDFNNWDGSLNLGADAPDLLINNLSGLSVMNAGVNGIGGSDVPFPFTYAYESGFCVRSDTWCGAYNGAF